MMEDVLFCQNRSCSIGLKIDLWPRGPGLLCWVAVAAVLLIHVKKGNRFYEMKPFIASNTLEMLRMKFIFPWLQKEL